VSVGILGTRAGVVALLGRLLFLAPGALMAVTASAQPPPRPTREDVGRRLPGGGARLGQPGSVNGARSTPDVLAGAMNELLATLESRGGQVRALSPEAAEPPRIVRADDGYVRSVGAPPASHFVVFGAVTASAPDEIAVRFLESHAALFGVAGAPFGLVQHNVNRGAGRSYVKLQQTYRGVPILGARAIVQVDDSNGVEFALLGLSRRPRLPAFANLGVSPVVAADAAGALAVATIGDANPGAILVHSDPELVVYDPGLLDEAGPIRLAWRLSVDDGDDTVSELVLVDALDGSILLHFSQLESALSRTVNNSNNLVGSSGTLARSEGDAATGDAEVDQAYDNCGLAYAFYSTRFGRDSVDGAGLPLRSFVRYCSSSNACPMHNAFWLPSSKKIYIGQGFGTDDTMAHELTHGVTQFESNLFYWNESGAINESLSDIFGELVDLTDGAGLDTPAVRWLLGEELPGGALRSMSDPSQHAQPDRRWSGLWYAGLSDNRGVHTNSGVGNKLAYLLTDGDTFRGFSVAGVGIDSVASLFYEVQTNLLTPTADYYDLYLALTQAAVNLSWSRVWRDNLEAACRAVQIATASAPVTVFSDDFEGPFPGSNWQVVSATTAQWGSSTKRSSGGAASVWCAGGGSLPGTPGGNYFPSMNTAMIYGPFSLADAAHATLSFDFWLRTENLDPLEILVSVNGTDFYGWTIAGSLSSGVGDWYRETLNLGDLTAVLPLGEPEVWAAFVFTSTKSGQKEGVYIDNVAIKKFPCGGTPEAPVVTAPATVPSGLPFTVSWTATSPITTYELDEATSPSFAGETTYQINGLSRTLVHSDAGATHYFRVRALGDCDDASPSSATAQTLIGAACDPAAISVQPVDRSIQSGQTASLAVTATGTGPVTYQWYQGTSGSTGSPIAGATAAVYTTSALTATTSYWVRVSNGCGTEDSHTVTVTVATAVPTRFDFGTATSPVAAGFTRVAPTAVYSVAPRLRHVAALSSTGFGWVSGTVDARDRGTGGDLNRDFNFTHFGTFAVDVVNGAYDVKVTMGDATGAHNLMGVFLEGWMFDNVTTAANQFIVTTYRGVTVADGQLTLILQDQGGSDPNCVINGLELTPSKPRQFDFGTPTSPVAGGHVGVTNTTTYTPQLGYGWLSGTIASRDRATGTSLNRDFNFTPLGTFAVDLPNGTYSVVIVMGDATAAHDQMGVYLEGTLVDTVTTAANQFSANAYQVTVSDGQLTVKLDDLGGSDGNVVINGLEVR
jgi:Zn-dependent metalloprotease/fibronectin type 3 domain-containing protein